MTGNQFKSIRTQLGLSQDELAKVLGLSGKQVISNIETGFRNPSPLIMALMQAFVELPEKRSRELRDLLVIISKRQQGLSSKARR